MRKLVVLLLLISINVPVIYSQTTKCRDSSSYSFLFFEGQIADTSKLELEVKYKNYDRQNILIYKNLVDAVEYGQPGNFYLDMEKFKNEKYEKYVDKTVDHFFTDENKQDERSEYNELRPGDSAVLKFNLIGRIGAFYKGKYRIRINLLKVPDNCLIKNGMDYATSRWFYFEVLKDWDYHELYYPQSN